MKKRSFLFIGLLASLALSACGGGTPSKESVPEQSTETPSSEVIDSSIPTEESKSVAPSSEVITPSSETSSAKPSSSSAKPSSSAPQSSSQAPSSSAQQPSSSEQPFSSVQPVVTQYYVLYDGHEFAMNEKERSNKDEIAEYIAQIGNIEKGKHISILDSNKMALSENFNAEEGDNNISGEVGNYVIHNDAESAFVIVKEWKSGWTNFYVSGYEEEPVIEPVYKVVGSMNEWSYQNSTIVFTDDTKAEEVELGYYVKQLKASFTVYQNDIFKVFDGNETWFGGSILEAHPDFTVLVNGNIKALHQGATDIYLKQFSDGTYGLAIYFVEAEPEHYYYVFYNDHMYGADLVNEPTLAENQTAQYKAEIDSVEAGKSIAIYDRYLTPLVNNYNADPNDSNNVLGDVGNFTIHNDATNVYVLINVYNTPWVNFFVSGFELPPEPSYVIVGSMNEWSIDNSALILEDATDPDEVELGYYIKQFKISFDVNAEDMFKVASTAGDYYGNEILEANENFATDDNANIVALYKGSVELFFKFKENGNSIYINFTKEEVVPEYKYYVQYDGDDFPASLVEDATLGENQLAQYRVELGHIEGDKRIGILDENKVALSENYNAAPGENNVRGEVGNYITNNTADDVYVLINVYNTPWVNFFVSGYQAPAGPDVSDYVVVGNMNSWAAIESTIKFVDATDPEEVALEWYLYQFKTEFEVEENDEFKVFCFANDNFYGFEALESNENFTDTDTGNIKALYKGSIELYLKFYVAGGIGIAINFTKAEDPIEPPTPTEYTYTVTDLPDWIQNDDCVIFAWIWADDDGGSWQELTFGDNHDASFVKEGEELDGFLLVRCVAGTVTPNWELHSGSEPGRVFNKTNDIICSEGVYSYVCASWVEYN